SDSALPRVSTLSVHDALPISGNDVVIAGQDLDPDPGMGQGRDRNAGALLWRIEEGDIAEQGKTALVFGSVACVGTAALFIGDRRSEEHTSELQSRVDLVCRLL